MNNRPGVTYRPEIDGLRAISIIGVLLFHAKIGAFSGGYVGVDIFFVVSGYLITRYILSDIAAGRFTFYRFYTRRIRRLFPALFFTMLASFLAAVVLLSPEDLRDFARMVVATFAAISNTVVWRDSHDYFVTNTDYLPLLHTWSLSLEEQFYLVCPAALFVVARAGLMRVLAVMLAVAGLVSLVACEVWLPRDPSAVFYLAPFRVFEFVIGALCIEAEKKRLNSVLARQAIAVAGLAAIAAAIFGFSKQTPFPGLAALLPCLGAAMVIYTGDVPQVGRLLTNRLAVGVGLISYSLYLCHWPILVFARYAFGETSSTLGKLILIVLSVVVAIGMYLYVETPYRKAAALVSLTTFFKLAGVCAGLVSLLAVPAIYVVLHDGLPGRLSAVQQIESEKHRNGLTACIADGSSQCAFGDLKGQLGLQLIGDSQMEHLIPALIPIAREFHLRGEALTQGGCPMLQGLQRILANGDINRACRQFRDQSFVRIRANAAPVVISQRWEIGALADDAGKALSLQPAARHMAVWREALENTIAALGAERRYLLIGAQVNLACDIDRRAIKIGPLSPMRAVAPCPVLSLADAQTKTANINAMLRAVQRSHSQNVTLLLPEDYICADGRCIAASNGLLLYQDNAHFTVAGADYMGARANNLLRKFVQGYIAALPGLASGH
jgi:peptidoglycan/LPS O-acetylase OafA/YrhL